MRRVVPALVTGLLALAPGLAAAEEPLFRAPPPRPDAVRVLLVTGGHDHDISFYSVLDGQDALAVTVDPYPNAFQSPVGGEKRSVDVLVLYDMPADLQPVQQENLRAFVESGKGVVALHHAISGRTEWKWWYEEVVGGRYLFKPFDGRPASSYKHDETMSVRPRGAHPITVGIGPFRIFDETYKGLWISPRASVLLETDNPTSDGPVLWTFPHPRARVVYLQLGHGPDAHRNPVYRQLVRNSVLWAAGRLE
jgi:uncharacterized protein